MRIHTDCVTSRDVHEALAGMHSDVYAEVSTFGSRTRDHALEVRLFAWESEGRRHTNTGRYGAGDGAATWDEWGVMFARLFAADPNLLCGWAYSGFDHYHVVTGNRFTVEGVQGEPHMLHSWTRKAPDLAIAGELVTGRACKCGAIYRNLSLYSEQFVRIFGRTRTERGFKRVADVA